ncbi:hypothetical protein DFJ74DRAFT_770710 [Hyaloraphidium curvatum]|nr:hypothetical protein DFJ74DRAFT_770710 [Hyaloraphidium curvatum]
MALQAEHYAKAGSSSFPAKISDVPHAAALAEIRILNACIAACTACADRAVEEGMNCWRDCRRCTAACRAMAEFVSLNAPQQVAMARIVAECCEACAEVCGEHAKHGSEHCRDCAEACRKCVEVFGGRSMV